MGNEKCFFQLFPAILIFLFVEAKKKKRKKGQKLPISKGKQGEAGNWLSIDLLSTLADAHNTLEPMNDLLRSTLA